MAASMVSSSDADMSSLADPEEEPLVELTDEELNSLVQETSRTNEVLEIETQMFEQYLRRVDPKDLAMMQTGTTTLATTEQSTKRSFRSRSRSRGQSIDRHLKLSAEQKCDIATRELEELREEIERMKEDAEKKLDNFRAIMEEAELRYVEVKKSQYEFNRDIVNGAVNPRTNKVIAEKLTRSIEDKIRARDTLIEKLRLKNSTLKVQKKKLQQQLKQKEEMGEVLHEVDFNQLKIENSQYLEKIDERNQDLLRLKLMATNVLQVLNTYKKKLAKLTQESEELKNEISQRKELLLKIDTEQDTVQDEKDKADLMNRKYRQQLSDYKVPDVMDYVQERADLYDLRKAVQSWERKVEIASMALKTNQAKWQHLKAQAAHENQVQQPTAPGPQNWNRAQKTHELSVN